MRAVPQIDIQPQPAPAQHDASARSQGRGEGNFAETLQRSNEAAHERPPQRPHDKPETSDKPEKPTAEKSSDDSAPEKPVKSPAAKGKTGDDPAQPPSDDGIVDPAIAAALIAPLVPVISPPTTAPTTLTEFDLLAAATVPTDDGLNLPSAAPNLAPATAPAAPLAVAPLIAAIPPAAPEQTALQIAAPQVSNAALTATPSADAAPTADATLLASATPVMPVAQAPTPSKSNDPALPVLNTLTTSTEVDPAAALPPVVAGDNAAKADLPPQPTATPANVPIDEATPTGTLPSATPTTSATPATQSAGMHAVAAAIGDNDAKAATPSETTAAVKSTGELGTPVTSQQPSTPVTPTRPLSDTVLAQNTLAQQGNAMEKAVSHQVSKALVQHLPNGDRMMVLRLTPPELGTVRVELIERQGVFSARLHAEDDGVRLALERFLPSMRQDLRASDAPIRELNLSDQAQFHRSFADGQQGQQQQQDANRPGNRRQREDAPRFSIDGVAPREPLAVPRAAPLGGRVGVSGVDARA